ncbi:transposase [Allisonella histaminiformans]|uniref:transposase n=1 Tax=Allisonella histaminiformans TaxID=209880 RepID=UPI0026E9C856|nr:transposase [Allisonella histaminiformans]
MDYTELLCRYSSCGRKTRLDPVTIFKIIVYVMSEGIYSTREMVEPCRKNMEYIWLMNSMYVPSHMVFGRFFQHIPE